MKTWKMDSFFGHCEEKDLLHFWGERPPVGWASHISDSEPPILPETEDMRIHQSVRIRVFQVDGPELRRLGMLWRRWRAQYIQIRQFAFPGLKVLT